MSTANITISTLAQCLSFMASFAGGSVPSVTDSEYLDWVRWIAIKQEEYAKRGFWRRLLTKADLSIVADEETTVLPDNFHKSNGLYVLEVDGVDWAEPSNSDGQVLFVEMCIDSTDEDYGKWRIRYATIPTESSTATLWYFAAPPTPSSPTDILILPGDMIAYGALTEYFRTSNQEGSMDKAEQDAENRFISYLSLEMIPSRYELLSFGNGKPTRTDRLTTAKNYYRSRINRNTQG